MKLSNETLTILKNFANINSGIFFKQGNKLSTVSSSKTILAEAELGDSFPQDFGIYDLNKFLGVVNMYKDNAELEFDAVNVNIGSGRAKTKYRLTDKTMIVAPPDKQLSLPSVDVQFQLSADDLEWILKTANVLQSPNVAVESDGDVVKLVMFDASNDSADISSIDLDVQPQGKRYKLVFKTENLKMIPGHYEVQISSKGIANFNNNGGAYKLQYWIATEAGVSKFEG
jgi:hypothetical protein